MVEHYLGLQLAKEHSAVDWSARPLPEPWLRYAALDVEVLVDLRDAVAADLASQGKVGLGPRGVRGPARLHRPGAARRPVAPHVGDAQGAPPTRIVAIVRELWQRRDAIAQERDISPGRVLPDAAIVEIAMADQRATQPPRTWAPPNRGSPRSVRRHQEAIIEVVGHALALPESDLPPAPCGPTVRPHPRRGPTATRSPPPVWLTPGSCSAPSPRSSPYRSRTSSPPTCCAVSSGTARPLRRRRGRRGARRLGARRWQTTITAPLISLACGEHRPA